MIKLLSAASFLCLSFRVHALMGVPCKKTQFHRLSEFVQKTKVFGTDDRKTFEEYAKAHRQSVSTIERKFAATGLLECGNAQTTAQLTESNSVITTSRHFFKDQNNDCKNNPTLNKECSFIIHDSTGWNSRYSVDMSSLRMGNCEVNIQEEDWAVINLQKPVRGIKPYKTANLKTGLDLPIKVINPAAYSIDFKVANSYPRVINDCEVRDLGQLAKTTCDTGEGASGSANLIEDGGSLAVVAIVIGTTTYNTGRMENISTPMKGEFYEAVKAASAK